MGFWKVLGGIALGAGAIALGPVGLVAAGAVAVAGSGDKPDDPALAAAKKKLAELTIQNGNLQEIANKYQMEKGRHKVLIGLFAVGFSISNADGVIDERETEVMNRVIGGVAHKFNSPELIENIENLKDNPPNFEEAMMYVKNYIPREDWKIIDMVLYTAALSDGCISESEKNFMNKWKMYKEENK